MTVATFDVPLFTPPAATQLLLLELLELLLLELVLVELLLLELEEVLERVELLELPTPPPEPPPEPPPHPATPKAMTSMAIDRWVSARKSRLSGNRFGDRE